MDLVTLTDAGLYCPAGDFHIDPWRPVARAVITPAHGDHARPGHERYLAARAGEQVLRVRLGPDATTDTLAYGKSIDMHGVRVSLHPAGHVLGSAQVRIEYRDEVWVVSGDYRIEADRTCAAFEPLHCDVFVTESTFGLPVYRWRPQTELFAEIEQWWRANQAVGRASVLFAYALGKAQRLLFRELVGRHHYLGHAVPFGAPLRYLFYSGEQVLGAMQFFQPGMAVRERWIGWDEPARRGNLQRVVSQSRFLILPWVHIANLASVVLSRALRRVRADWQARYGLEPLLVETLVDESRYSGHWYRAANCRAKISLAHLAG